MGIFSQIFHYIYIEGCSVDRLWDWMPAELVSSYMSIPWVNAVFRLLPRHLTSCFIPISACCVVLWQYTWFPHGTNPFWSPTSGDLLRSLSAGMSVRLGLLAPGVAPAECCSCPVLCVTLPQSAATLTPISPLIPQRQQRLHAHEIRCAACQGSLDGLWSPFLLEWGLSSVLDLTLYTLCRLSYMRKVYIGYILGAPRWPWWALITHWWYLLLAEPALLLAGVVLLWN